MFKIKKKLILIFISIIIIGVVWTVLPLKPILVKYKLVFVEIASTQDERSRGLQGRIFLAENQGMLFVFEEEGLPGFWMKDTLLPLSIAFINKQKAIVDIQKMQPQNSEVIYVPAKKSRYALEMNADWFEKNKIKIGDKCRFW